MNINIQYTRMYYILSPHKILNNVSYGHCIKNELADVVSASCNKNVIENFPVYRRCFFG